MIAIIDYGLGNVRALLNIYERLKIPVRAARDVAELAGSTRLILPGVGAFDRTMEQFTKSGLRTPVEEMVLGRKVPILGICVGMQMLASSSEEGELEGLKWVPGRVLRLRTKELSLPHMGWNDVLPARTHPLFVGLETGARFYFLHSYFFQCDTETNRLAVTDYGGAFSCAVAHENIFGVQFHPEKSHRFGVQLLKNFAQLPLC